MQLETESSKTKQTLKKKIHINLDMNPAFLTWALSLWETHQKKLFSLD